MARNPLRRYFRHGLLPQLIAFEACLRLGSVTRAADELSLAQPTVSGLLKRLSETIGEPVMHARGGRMEISAAGHDVLALCIDVLEAFRRFDDKRCRMPTQPGTPPAQSRGPDLRRGWHQRFAIADGQARRAP